MTGPSKAEDIKWQTEEDARTMQHMGEIMADGKRHERAKKKVDEMIADMEKSKKMMEGMKNAKMDYSKSMPEKKK